MALLNRELEQTDFGIVVLTPESLLAPWIHYEAGALAKKVETGAVSPYLVDIPEKTTVTGPLAQFQSKLANEKETLDLLKEINKRVQGTGKLNDTRLNETFKLFWPSLEKVLSSIPTERMQQAKRPQEDVLTEILERVRSLERQGEQVNSVAELEAEVARRATAQAALETEVVRRATAQAALETEVVRLRELVHGAPRSLGKRTVETVQAVQMVHEAHRGMELLAESLHGIQQITQSVRDIERLSEALHCAQQVADAFRSIEQTTQALHGMRQFTEAQLAIERASQK
jgi:hypothetical protein